MAISSSSIIDLALPIHERDVFGIQDQVVGIDPLLVFSTTVWNGPGAWDTAVLTNIYRNSVNDPVDPQGFLTDEAILIFPRNDTIQELWFRDDGGKLGVRRPHIQKAPFPFLQCLVLYKGCKSFEYLVLPIDPANTVPLRILTLEVPPHLALCTTYGKIVKTWGFLPRKVCDANQISLVKRANEATQGKHQGRPALGMRQLQEVECVHRKWSWADYVPPSFLFEDSDRTMTMVEPDEEPSDRKRKSPDRSSAARHDSEPKRRLLSLELQAPVKVEIRLFPSVDGKDENNDDAISVDSHISGVEGDPEEFVKASRARGDYEVGRKWLKKMKRWAAGTSGADTGETLFNDAQINDDWRERPRDASSLDLDKPHFLARFPSRTAV
ncbi:hypothetical protein B0H14DRAFT_2586088 [Mycena olivaceomarginata]|nr:hypothetical protein B0H14DRAFT_2586088 [Mycena olivaceomarginata]